MTRSAVSLVHGDFSRSIFFHPLGPVAVVAVACFAVLRLFLPSFRLPGRVPAFASYVGIAALLVVWLARLDGLLPVPPM